MIPWNDGPNVADQASAGHDAGRSVAPAFAPERRHPRGPRYEIGALAVFVLTVGIAFASWRASSGPSELVGGVTESGIAASTVGATPQTASPSSPGLSPGATDTAATAESSGSAGPDSTTSGSTTPGSTPGSSAPGSTSGSATPDPTFVSASGAPRTPQPTAAPRPTGTIYGSAIAIDTKDNFVIGGPSLGKVAHRFRASTSSALSAIRWAQRGGTAGYSGGNGGAIRISVQADVGGQPSGQPLASLTYVPSWPGGTWAQFYQQTFPSPARLSAGGLYDIVFENADPNPAANYISVNDVLVYRYVYSPRQVAMGNDYAVMYSENGGGWRLRSSDTAVMDLTYANGRHDGMAYIQAMAPQAAYISGAAQMARERFTVSGSTKVVVAATVRVLRLAGSGTNPLIVRLEDGSGAEIESVGIPATSIPVSSVGDTSGGTWVTVRFRSAHALNSGSSYNLRLSTDSGVVYVAVPIREGTDIGFRSYRFADGDGQKTTNGSTWANCYKYSPVDLQFYLS